MKLLHSRLKLGARLPGGSYEESLRLSLQHKSPLHIPLLSLSEDFYHFQSLEPLQSKESPLFLIIEIPLPG